MPLTPSARWRAGGRRLQRLACLSLVSAAGVALAGPALADVVPAHPASPVSTPKCFGAASRDLRHPCANPALRRVVKPTPANAVIEPNAPCTILGQRSMLLFCAFGTPRTQATRTAALIGDSHAAHFRAGLDVALASLGWRGISITRSSCPFSTAVADLREPLRSQCLRWKKEIVAWLRRHPTVSTVFISQHRAAIVSRRRRGHGSLDEQVADYHAAWQSLPRSIKHIVIIRDVPRVSSTNASCVSHAIAARKRPGPACAQPRRYALPLDPAAVAAAHTQSPRVQLIDLTPFMCSRRLCFPVVGGVLVHKDTNHLTRAFSESLGPYLLHKITHLTKRWSDRDRPPAVTAPAPAPTPTPSPAPTPPTTPTPPARARASTARPRAVASDRPAAGAAVPILTYHHVAEAVPADAPTGLWVSAEALAAQLEALASVGYHVVTLNDVWRSWHGGPALPAQPVVLSFDDGYAGQAAIAAPALRARGWRGVLNLQLDRIGADGGLTARQVRGLIAAGWEIDDHTFTHPDLRRISAARLQREVAASRIALRRRFGVAARFFAYPFGRRDARVQAAVRAAGFVAATTVRSGLASPSADPFQLRRIVVGGTWTGPRLLDALRAAGA